MRAGRLVRPAVCRCLNRFGGDKNPNSSSVRNACTHLNDIIRSGNRQLTSSHSYTTASATDHGWTSSSETRSSPTTSISKPTFNTFSKYTHLLRRQGQHVARHTHFNLSKRRFHTKQKNASLQNIPGVGPKTAGLFQEQGILSLEQLNNKLRQNDVSLVDVDQIAVYLKEQVGVRHRRHARVIAEYVREYTSVNAGGPKVTVSIEGNISVGKSTLMQHMQARDSGMSAITEFVMEPVERWQNVRGHNVLEAFYENPERYAYTFQSFVFLTRLLEGGLAPSELPQRLLERSVFSDSMVFLRAIHNSRWLSEMEFELLTTYFNPLCQKFPQIVPNGFIYLRADPETCFRRLQHRARSEEASVSLPYLRQIHEYHEQWFEPSNISHDAASQTSDSNRRIVSVVPDVGPAPETFLEADAGRNQRQVFANSNNCTNGFQTDVNGNTACTPLVPQTKNIIHPGNMNVQVPALIRDNVVYLRGRDGFSIFEQIPTLILDCDDDTMSSDTIAVSTIENRMANNERFAKHALMVECFFGYLRELQATSNEGDAGLNRDTWNDTGSNSELLGSTTNHARNGQSHVPWSSSGQVAQNAPPLHLKQDEVARRLLDQLMSRTL